jgi:hypothetical protein
MAEATSDPHEAASREYLQLLEAYFQKREAEDALREDRAQIAVRLKVLGAHLDGRKAARTGFAKPEGGEA